MSEIQMPLSETATAGVMGLREPTWVEVQWAWRVMVGEMYKTTRKPTPGEYKRAKDKQRSENVKWYEVGRTDHLRDGHNKVRNWIGQLSDDALVMNYWHAHAESQIANSGYWQGVRDACAENAMERGVAIPDIDATILSQRHLHCHRCQNTYGWEAKS